MNTKKPSDRFIMKNDKGMRALRYWLKDRNYNSYVVGLQDKNCNPMIGLSWDRDPDSDWSAFEQRGLIVMVDMDYFDQTEEMVEKYRMREGSQTSFLSDDADAEMDSDFVIF